MTLEEVVVEKLQKLPENERKRLLMLIDDWIKQHATAEKRSVQRAVMAVQNTWATLSLDGKTLHWVATDRELEYDLG